MKETLDILFRLQKLDDEIDALEKEKAKIPVDKEEIGGKVKEMEEAIQKIKEESLDVAKLRDEEEIDLKQIGEQISRFQSQLYQVKTNREYESLQHEIDALKEKSSKIEDKILELLENTERIAAAAAEEEKNLGEYRVEAGKNIAELEARDRQLAEQLAAKRSEREKLIVDIDRALLARYDRIREKKAGMAVAVVRNGACGGCFRHIPPQETQELKKMERIVTCEGCGRIIVWRDE